MGVLGLSGASIAAPQKPQTSDLGRIGAIWSYAQDRIDRQTDVWFEDGNYPASIQALRVSAELEPNNYDTVTNLGWMLENVEQWDQAVVVYKRYRDDNPNDPDSGMPLGQYYYLKKKYDQVPQYLEPLLNDKRPPHPNVWRMLASSYEKLHKYEDSERVWKRYIVIAPADNQAKNNLQRVEKKMQGAQ